MRCFLSPLVGLATVLSLLTVPAVTAALPAAAAPTAAASSTLATQAGAYRTVTQLRVLDTRSGIGGPRTALAPGEIRTVKVAGVGSLPATGVSAVAVNVGVLAPARSGSVTVFPGGTAWTRVGSISFPAGVTVQSSLTAKLGGAGTLALRNNTGVPLQLIADVSGYYLAGTPTAAGAFGAVTLARVLDTRSGIGGPATALASGQTRTVQVTGHGGVPATGVSAVAVNVGVLAPARSGSVTVFPGRTAWTGVGSISFAAGVTVQSSLTAKLGADGTLAVRNNTALPLQLIADVSGYYLAGTATMLGAYAAIALTRVLDTRRQDTPPLHPGETVEVGASAAVDASGARLVPVTGVTAVAANIGVLGPPTAGSISVYPGNTAWTRTGSISFPAGGAVQSSLTATLGVAGTLLIRNNSAADLHVIVDVAGYYLGQPAPAGFGPVEQADQRHGGVNSLSCVSASSCVAVEANGYTLGYDGQDWSPAAKLPTAVTLSSVSCAGPTFCMAVGRTATRGLAYTYDGHSWSDPTTLAANQPSAVSCSSTAFCMVVDWYGGAQSYDGASWSPRTQLPGRLDLLTVSCVSAAFCVALDGLESAAMFDGASWSVVVMSPGFGSVPTRRQVSCASQTFCVAAGYGRVSVYDGNQWSTPALIGSNAPLQAVSCPSATFCAIVDKAGQVITFDGQSWTTTKLTAGSIMLGTVSCSSAASCVAIDLGAVEHAYHFDGAAWGQPVYVDAAHGALSGVSCAGPDFCMVMDRWGAARSYTASGWSAWTELERGTEVSALSCASAAFCVAVDGAGRALTYTGSGWDQPVAIDGARKLTSVSCAATTSCVAVDSEGWAVSYDNGAWSPPAKIDAEYLRAVSCASPQFCVAADALGRALIRVGADWSQPADTPLSQATELSCPSSSFCVMTSVTTPSYPADNGTAVYDGARWSAVPTNWYQNLPALSCPSAGRCLGIDRNALAVGFDGAHWSLPGAVPAGLGPVADLSCAAGGLCMVVYQDGYATHTAA